MHAVAGPAFLLNTYSTTHTEHAQPWADTNGEGTAGGGFEVVHIGVGHNAEQPGHGRCPAFVGDTNAMTTLMMATMTTKRRKPALILSII